MKSLAVVISSCVLAVVPSLEAQAPCLVGTLEQYTNDFAFMASSEQGAVGDVVAVELSVATNANYNEVSGLHIFGCYDDSMAELLPSPELSEAFDAMAFASSFHANDGSIGPSRLPGTTGNAFRLYANLSLKASPAFFPAETPLLLAKIFFRLKGSPGDSFQVRFCDDAWVEVSDACVRNHLYQNGAQLSDLHVPGEVRILEGPPTHPDPPSLPPDAKVYVDEPTAETAEIRFEVAGGIAQPGAMEVPVPVFVTSNHEFSGYLVSVKFPGEHLELARVEEHVRPGIVKIDNELGAFGVVMLNSNRRVGAEGERVKLVTLYFNVKESARTAGSLPLEFSDFGPYTNFLAIRFHNGQIAEPLPIVSEVNPLVILNGLLKVQDAGTVPGDANLDYQVDMGDAITILTRLFLDGSLPICREAGDFDGSSVLDITDAIAILDVLFRGRRPPPAREVYCGSGALSS